VIGLTTRRRPPPAETLTGRGLGPRRHRSSRGSPTGPAASDLTTRSRLAWLGCVPVRTSRTPGTAERATPVPARPHRRGRSPPPAPRRRRRRNGSSVADRHPRMLPPAGLPFGHIDRTRRHAWPGRGSRPHGRSPSLRRPARVHRTTSRATHRRAHRRPTLGPPAGSAHQTCRTPSPVPTNLPSRTERSKGRRTASSPPTVLHQRDAGLSRLARAPQKPLDARCWTRGALGRRQADRGALQRLRYPEVRNERALFDGVSPIVRAPSVRPRFST
jgi:hypothetical protein